MKIHLGCGKHVKNDWLNVDLAENAELGVIGMDLSKGINSFSILGCLNFDYVYSSHFFEHLTFEQGQRLMKDCRERMLQGKTFRMCLPDFRKMVTAYLNNDWEFFNVPAIMHFASNRQMMEIMNYGLYQRQPDGTAEHVCMYDVEYAIFALESAGFRNCKEVAFDPAIDLEDRQRFSFYVEGIK